MYMYSELPDTVDCNLSISPSDCFSLFFRNLFIGTTDSSIIYSIHVHVSTANHAHVIMYIVHVYVMCYVHVRPMQTFLCC